DVCSARQRHSSSDRAWRTLPAAQRGREASALRALDAEGADQRVEMRARHLDDVPAGLLERLADELRLEAPRGLLERGARADLRHRSRNVGGDAARPCRRREDVRALDAQDAGTGGTD